MHHKLADTRAFLFYFILFFALKNLSALYLKLRIYLEFERFENYLHVNDALSYSCIRFVNAEKYDISVVHKKFSATTSEEISPEITK